MTKYKDPYDVLQDAVDNRRLGQKVRDAICEFPADDLRTIAEALTELADQLDTSIEMLDALDDAEGRDEKADARDAAFDEIEAVIEAIETARGCTLPDVVAALGCVDGVLV